PLTCEVPRTVTKWVGTFLLLRIWSQGPGASDRRLGTGTLLRRHRAREKRAAGCAEQNGSAPGRSGARRMPVSGESVSGMGVGPPGFPSGWPCPAGKGGGEDDCPPRRRATGNDRSAPGAERRRVARRQPWILPERKRGEPAGGKRSSAHTVRGAPGRCTGTAGQTVP